jgi:hypothetical protein
MAILGPRALLDSVFPPGVDANEVLRFQMQEGMTPQEIIALAATTIGEANEYIHNRYGGFFALTERAFARYRNGANGSIGMTPLASEFSLPDGMRTEAIGHMLPLRDYNDAVEWSRRYLERAHRESLRDDLTAVRDKWINRCDVDLLTRAFSVSENPIGQAGWDVGWVIGDPGQNRPYIPPQRGSRQFDETINHYLRVDAALDATSAETTLVELAKKLSFQGHTGDKYAMVSEADVDIYLDMDPNKFVRVIPGQVNLVTGGSNPILTMEGTLSGVPGQLFGMLLTTWGHVWLYHHERVPSGYLWLTKIYGVNSSMNGLAIRTEAGKGFGLVVEPRVSASLVPALESMFFYATHGVGVNDRTNGAVAQIEAGAATYENPTIAA